MRATLKYRKARWLSEEPGASQSTHACQHAFPETQPVRVPWVVRAPRCFDLLSALIKRNPYNKFSRRSGVRSRSHLSFNRWRVACVFYCKQHDNDCPRIGASSPPGETIQSSDGRDLQLRGMLRLPRKPPLSIDEIRDLRSGASPGWNPLREQKKPRGFELLRCPSAFGLFIYFVCYFLKEFLHFFMAANHFLDLLILKCIES